MKRLEPDAEDLRIAATISQLPCPFCGGHPLTMHNQNEDTGFVVSRVFCPGCDANVFSCGSTRDEARQSAFAKWSRRT